MAKKETSESSYFRFPFILLILALAAGGWWLWDYSDEWKSRLFSYIENGEILTLESKYTPEQIMEAHRKELLGNNGKRTFQEPVSKYYPYLLLDVKYTEDKKSREGFLLWSLTDGEMVLNTENWESTHGFKDCLECEATRTDFKILQALARHSGSLSVEDLQKDLHVDRELLDPWLESTKAKHLVVQKGNLVQLHFENPRLLVIPQTQIRQHLVSKPIQNGQRGARTFSRSQIVKIAKAAFGDDFTIRSEKEVFLPVYSLSVLNPDNSIHTSDWNAITGQKIKTKP